MLECLEQHKYIFSLFIINYFFILVKIKTVYFFIKVLIKCCFKAIVVLHECA